MTQVARESILAATDKASQLVTTARNPIARGIATPSRSPSMYLSRSIRSSTRSLPLESGDKKTQSDSDASDNPQKGIPQQTLSTDPRAQDGSLTAKRKRSSNEVPSETKAEQDTPQKPTSTAPKAQEDKVQAETLLSRGWFPLFGESTKVQPPKPPDTTAASTANQLEHASEPQNGLEALSTGQDTLPRTWLGLWSSASSAKAGSPNAVASAATASPNEMLDTNIKGRSGISDPQTTSTAKSSGWAFWSREAPRNVGANPNLSGMGELALAGSTSESHPESAVLDGVPEVLGTKPRLVSSPRKEGGAQSQKPEREPEASSELIGRSTRIETAERRSRPRSQDKNLLLPPITDTYRRAERPSFWQSLNWWWQYKRSSDPNNARFVEKPPRIKRALVIVRTYFFRSYGC